MTSIESFYMHMPQLAEDESCADLASMAKIVGAECLAELFESFRDKLPRPDTDKLDGILKVIDSGLFAVEEELDNTEVANIIEKERIKPYLYTACIDEWRDSESDFTGDSQ